MSGPVPTYFPACGAIPFVLAPASPLQPPLDGAVKTLQTRYSLLYQNRRETGSHANDNLLAGSVLPPLISAAFKGRWDTSPWSRTKRGRLTAIDGTDSLLAELGIPRDQNEVKDRTVEVNRRKRAKVSLGEGTSAGISGWAQKASTTSRQTSIASTLGTSSKASLTFAAANGKPGSAASASSRSARSQASKPAAPEQLLPSPTIVTPVFHPITLPSPDAPPEQQGRSLGEDEEVLFEGGCTQMVLSPHLHPSRSSPHPTGSPSAFPTPSLPKDLRTSTPQMSAAASAAPLAPQPSPSAYSPRRLPFFAGSPPSASAPTPGAGERRLLSSFMSEAHVAGEGGGRVGSEGGSAADEDISDFLKEDAEA